MGTVPEVRIRDANYAPARPDGAFVLYWMSAHHRARWNFALERAVEWAREFGRPLLVLEHLPCGRRWDSDRLHRFALEGMAANAAALRRAAVRYYPFVARRPGEGMGLVAALAERACAVVADEFPSPGSSRRVREAAEASPVLVEAVDSNGLLPLRAAGKVFATAHSLRRFLQRELPVHLRAFPSANPLARVRLPALRGLPRDITRRWPPAGARLLSGSASALAALSVSHSVSPGKARGGANAAAAALRRFLRSRLVHYAEDRNHPDRDATSGLSPYLHHGHISAHEIASRIMTAEDWATDRIAAKTDGSRTGWWGMSASAEAFLDQLVTWREVGYNMAWHRADCDRYASLPEWARATLARHAGDRRDPVYSREALEAAETHDPLWNAAQRQLVREGRLHNYLRMLWGKKILQWSPSPEEALDRMIHLNNTYALDGRNPNSLSGIFWVLGRYDRPWGPERPIFGTVRYMTSASTVRKVRVRDYLERYGP